MTKIVIPDSVTEIVEGAFANCYSLENITLSQNLKQIEEYTFNCCNSLKSIALPASLAQINETAFDRCCALEKYIVDSKNNRYYDIDGVLFDRYTNMLLRYPEGKTNCEYIIPEDINQLGNVAFAGCGMLKNIRFPASLKKSVTIRLWNVHLWSTYSLTSITRTFTIWTAYCLIKQERCLFIQAQEKRQRM